MGWPTLLFPKDTSTFHVLSSSSGFHRMKKKSGYFLIFRGWGCVCTLTVALLLFAPSADPESWYSAIFSCISYIMIMWRYFMCQTWKKPTQALSALLCFHLETESAHLWNRIQMWIKTICEHNCSKNVSFTTLQIYSCIIFFNSFHFLVLLLILILLPYIVSIDFVSNYTFFSFCFSFYLVLIDEHNL